MGLRLRQACLLDINHRSQEAGVLALGPGPVLLVLGGRGGDFGDRGSARARARLRAHEPATLDTEGLEIAVWRQIAGCLWV